MNKILLWGLVPPLLLLLYTWRLDRVEREPLGLVIRVFLLGAASTFAALVLESIAAVALEYLELDQMSYAYLILDNFLAIALIEEFCKRAPIVGIIWKNPNFNYRFDAIVYCLASALGFAATENIFYMMAYGSEIGLSRLIPVHAVCSIFMGYYLGIAKTADRVGDRRQWRRYKRLSLFIPMLIHGFWDFALTSEETVLYFTALGMIVILTVAAFDKLQKLSKSDRPV